MNEQLELIKADPITAHITLPEPSRRKVQKRDADGCLEGVEYIYTSEGLIDWRKMLKPEHLVVNKQIFERKGKPIPDSIEGLKDSEVLILLSGIRWLAHLRNFLSVKHTTTAPSPDYIVSACEIKWSGNYETNGQEITFSAIGDASVKNTNDFGRSYLGPIAENRAFVRAVRNFLKISVCASDEINPNAPNIEESSVENLPSDILTKTMKENLITFEKLKEILVKEGFEGAENFKCVGDIAKYKIFELISRIKKKTEEKK